MILSALVMAKTRNPPLVILALGLVQLFAYIIFYVWPTNGPFIIAVYYLCSAYGAIPGLISSWLNSCCGGDKQLRALSTSLMISVG